MDLNLKGNLGDGTRYYLTDLDGGVRVGFLAGEHYSSVLSRDLPRLLNFYRDLGEALEYLQPGLTKPLPDGSPDEVDAMKVIYEADRLRRDEA